MPQLRIKILIPILLLGLLCTPSFAGKDKHGPLGFDANFPVLWVHNETDYFIDTWTSGADAEKWLIYFEPHSSYWVPLSNMHGDGPVAAYVYFPNYESYFDYVEADWDWLTKWDACSVTIHQTEDGGIAFGEIQKHSFLPESAKEKGHGNIARTIKSAGMDIGVPLVELLAIH